MENKLPVIDLSGEKMKPGTISWVSTRNTVCQALEEHGCFQVEYNQLPMELHSSIFNTLEDLYDLPVETKMKNLILCDIPDKPFRGYLCASSIHEGITIANPNTIEGIQKFTTLMWPDGNHRFSESAHKITKIMEEIDQTVMKMIFDYYGTEKHYNYHIKSTDCVLGLAKYKEHNKNGNNDLALCNHKDKTLTSILHQDDVNGLEVQTKDGDWVIYNPSSHTSFMYLAGEALQMWSNDRIKSCYHRVNTSGNKARYSLGLFTFSNGVIHTPDEFVDESHPLQYKPLDHKEYIKLVVVKAKQKIDYSLKEHCGV